MGTDLKATPVAEDGRAHRAAVLRSFGAREADVDALLAYTEHPFDLSGPLVLDDEPFVSAWEEYLAASASEGVFSVLQRALVQLRFPVREGLSETEAYRAATRRGDLAALGHDGLFEGGLRLAAPERLRLELRATPAGRIPVLTAPVREDFVALVRALTRRNEPAPIPDTMGALMVSGYNNWDRVARYRQSWEATETGRPWAEAFRALVPQRERYQDRFILLSEGPYSGVPAAHLGLDDAEWIRTSHVIRREHECAHYYCKRVLGTMRSNALDEFVADGVGVLAAGAPDPARWLRAFLTDEATGRLGSYCRDLTPQQEAVVRRLFDGVIERTPWHDLAGKSPEVIIRHLAAVTPEEAFLASAG